MITFQRLGTHGQFGNQMFQYALILAISERTGFEFGVPYDVKSDNRYTHFALPDIFANLTAKDSSGRVPKYHYQEPGVDFFTFRPDVFTVQDDTDFTGTFQAWQYFADHRARLLREFESAPQYR